MLKSHLHEVAFLLLQTRAIGSQSQAIIQPYLFSSRYQPFEKILYPNTL
jgi:hypothetical protein